MKTQKSEISTTLGTHEHQIWRIAHQLESFGAILQRQGTSASDGLEELIGLGFTLEDLAKSLNDISDSICRLNCRLSGASSDIGDSLETAKARASNKTCE